MKASVKNKKWFNFGLNQLFDALYPVDFDVGMSLSFREWSPVVVKVFDSD